jgi:uncharacterized protein YlaI
VATIQFGERESFGKVMSRGTFGGDFAYVVPVFGERCVCCNQDAQHRVQEYDPSTDRIEAKPIHIPVCGLCHDHALDKPTTAILLGSGACVGLALGGLAIGYLTKRPGDAFLWGMLGVAIAILAAIGVWSIRRYQHTKAWRANGHHPRLFFGVGEGRTLLTTTNDELAADLVSRNKSAKRIPDRRLGRGRLPGARVVKGIPDEERELTEDEKKRMIAEIMDPNRKRQD